MRDQGKAVDNEEPELPDLMSTYNVLDVPRQVRAPYQHIPASRNYSYHQAVVSICTRYSLPGSVYLWYIKFLGILYMSTRSC